MAVMSSGLAENDVSCQLSFFMRSSKRKHRSTVLRCRERSNVILCYYRSEYRFGFRKPSWHAFRAVLELNGGASLLNLSWTRTEYSYATGMLLYSSN